MADQARAGAVKFDIFTDILAVLSRAHFAFWLRDPKKREHSVPAKLLVALMFLTMALMALFGRGTSIVASAIYAVFFLATLCLAVFIVLARSRRVRTGQAAVLVEAYVVALFLTMLLLFHNVVYPIPFFSVDAGVNRGTAMQLAVAYGYSLPAAIYLTICSFQFAGDRVVRARRRLKTPRSHQRLDLRAARLRAELAAWAVFHYLVGGILIWAAVFAKEGRLNLLNEAVKSLV